MMKIRHGSFVVAAALLLSACQTSEDGWITPGDAVGGPALAEQRARERYAGKFEIEKVDVITERERIRMGGRSSNRVSGFTAYVKAKGCSGQAVLYFDSTASLRRETNSITC